MHFVLLFKLIVPISIQDDGDVRTCTPKDELPDRRQFSANNIPSHTIEQANQEFRQDN